MRVLFKNCSTWVGVVELIVIVVEFLVNCGGFFKLDAQMTLKK